MGCDSAGKGGGVVAGSGLFRYDIDLGVWPEALCNDGSGAIMYVRRAEEAALADYWVIRTQGGGSCGDGPECAARWCSDDTNFGMDKMSSTLAPTTGIVSVGAQTVDGTPCRIHFHGSDIFDAAIGSLRAGTLTYLDADQESQRMPDLDDAVGIVFAGAGGVTHQLDRLALASAGATVVGLHDSNHHADLDQLDFSTSTICLDDGQCTYAEYRSARWDDTVRGLWNGRVDESCLAWHPSDPHVFVRMDQQDPLIGGGMVDAALTVPGEGLIDATLFASIVSAQLPALPDIVTTAEEPPAKAPGFFGPSCGKHETLGNNDAIYDTTVRVDGGGAAPEARVVGRGCLGLRYHQGMLILLLACSHPDPTVLTDDTAGGGQDSSVVSDDSGDSGDSGLPDDPYTRPVVWVEPAAPVPGETATIFYDGPMAEHDQLRVHYGFNGWNEVQLDGLTETGGGGNTSWYVEGDMTRGDDGIYAATVTLASDARALHMAFVDPGTDEWDNHSGQDYVWGVTFPYIGPYLTLGQDQVVVHFETALSCLGTLEYGADADHLDHVLRGDVADNMHHITIPDLAPGQTVAYRVSDAQGRTSETQILTWRNADPFAFIAMSDMQDNGEVQRWSDIAETLGDAHMDAAFFLVSGDLTNDDNAGMWWTFFDKGRDLFDSIPLLPAPGNHDTPGAVSSDDLDSFIRYFDPPLLADGSPFQAITFGGASFFALTSETSLLPDSDQYAAMSAALDASPQGTVFAAWHIPPYDAGERHFNQQDETRPLTALFDGRVDVVVNGHEHLYQRFVPIRYDAVQADRYGRDGGVMYVVLPPAGNFNEDHLAPEDAEDAVSRDLLAYPAAADVVESELGFIRVEVSGTQTTLHAFGLGPLHEPVDAHEVDSVTWER